MHFRPFTTLHAALAAVALSLPLAALADTFTVTTTADSGPGSFRQALLDANAHPDFDTIEFDIPGAGVHTITTTSSLPHITDPVGIDGYTQPGSSPNTNARQDGINAKPLIEIDLTGNPPQATGAQLVFDAGAAESWVSGLVLNRFRGDAIDVLADGVTIRGNFIGTTADGSAAWPGQGGCSIRQSTGGTHLHVGGGVADRAEFNVLARCIILNPYEAGGSLIEGNYIGTDASGTHALNEDNTSAGIINAAYAEITGNLISGNGGGGIDVDKQAFIAFNLIGTQRDGASPLPNGNFGGISIDGLGSAVYANVIAFNACTAIGVRDNATALISQNSIHSNHFGIDLSTQVCGDPLPNSGEPYRGNRGQQYPIISASVAGTTATISGTIDTTASTEIHIEFFANAGCDASGYGQGEAYIGSTDVTTGADGHASFGPILASVPDEGYTTITATASGEYTPLYGPIGRAAAPEVTGYTSEFSRCAASATAPVPTTTTLASTPNPSQAGQLVTFTATVSGNAPTGGVQFRDGATPLGAPVALAGNTAILATSQLAAGSHVITAAYIGDAGNGPSTSAPLDQVVNAGGGTAPPATPATPVPVLPPWSLAVLLALLVLAARRRRQAGAGR